MSKLYCWKSNLKGKKKSVPQFEHIISTVTALREWLNKSLCIYKGKLNPDGVPRLLDIVTNVSFHHAPGFSDLGSSLPNITSSVKAPNLGQTFDLAALICTHSINLLERMYTWKLLQYLEEACILQYIPNRPHIQGWPGLILAGALWLSALLSCWTRGMTFRISILFQSGTEAEVFQGRQMSQPLVPNKWKGCSKFPRQLLKTT